MSATALLGLVALGSAVPSTPPVDTVRGGTLVVSILTAGVGGQVWERFGHNAIIISDTATGTGRVYNFGYFSFRQKNFFLRFAQGRMLYILGSRRPDQDVDQYIRGDRDVWIQQLNLTPAQAAALRDALVANDTDERRSYRYDYYRDNCSTRVRDALDRALAGALRREFSVRPTALTYRSETQRLMVPDPWVGTLIDVGEGHPVDRLLSAWEEMFLPRSFQRYLREVQVTDASGTRVPLVRSERQVHQSSRFVEPSAAPNRTGLFLTIGLLAGGILALLGFTGARHRLARVGFALVGTIWSLFAGLAGVLLLFLWFGTDHMVSSQNENVLLFTPVSLALVVLIPALTLGRTWGRSALRVALVIVGFGVVAVLAKLLPGFFQPNQPEIALLLPIHLGLAIGIWRLSAPASAPFLRGLGARVP